MSAAAARMSLPGSLCDIVVILHRDADSRGQHGDNERALYCDAPFTGEFQYGKDDGNKQSDKKRIKVGEFVARLS